MDPRPTFRELIAIRKRELEHMLVAARGHVAQIEAEIAEIDKAEKALPIAGIAVPSTAQLSATSRIGVSAKGHAGIDAAAIAHNKYDRFAQMTIKQLIMQALRDKHPRGFNTTHLREFIRDAYNRAITADSFRPQLLRLKSDNWIVARENVWYLTEWALVHDHPKSMNAADEPSEDPTAGISRDFDLGDSVRAVGAAMTRMKPKK